MTREEIKQLKGVEPNCFETSREEEWYCEGLVQGLEITEKELIDKACDWLSTKIYKYTWVSYDQHENGVEIDKLLNDFRKAMEDKT